MSTDHDCSCGDCTMADLPVNPFKALRASQGMLLGEDDFRTLMGNPRGKQMLHSAWLHGTGVVWGYQVRKDGELVLEIRPGLAMDGMGRELALDSMVRIDLREWRDRHDHPEHQDGCRTRTINACLVAEFDCSTACPVPTLADPCDVTRTHDTASRVVEGVRVVLVPGECPPCLPRTGCRGESPYHRLRVLLGLNRVSDDDPAGLAAAEARKEIAELPRDERAQALCHRLRCLAARDAGRIRPACQEGTDVPTRFPVSEQDAAVVLACVEIDVRDEDGCTTINDVRLDDCCRCVLLSTQTITEVLCALAACLLERDHEHHEHHESQPDDEPVEGPRVHADRVSWDEEERCYRVPVTGALVAGSVRRAVTVHSLSARGWVEEDVESVRFDPEESHLVVRLAAHPMNSVVRIVVKGTGPTPVFGVAPAAPLAGVWGGPPASRHDGRDAVITLTDALREREDS
jgi:hypothetical protein